MQPIFSRCVFVLHIVKERTALAIKNVCADRSRCRGETPLQMLGGEPPVSVNMIMGELSLEMTGSDLFNRRRLCSRWSDRNSGSWTCIFSLKMSTWMVV